MSGRERKLPKYTSGKSFRDFSRKYLAIARTRGRSYEALMGDFINTTVVEADEDTGVAPALTDEQKEMTQKNTNAYADLMNSKPHVKLVKAVSNAVTDEFPEGCAGTAWQKITAMMEKIINR